MRLQLTCDGASVAPRNGLGVSKYPYVSLTINSLTILLIKYDFRDSLGPNQACTLFGSESGQVLVNGSNYLRVGYQYNVADLWRLNFVMLIVFFVVFQITQIVALEYFPVRFAILFGLTICA